MKINPLTFLLLLLIPLSSCSPYPSTSTALPIGSPTTTPSSLPSPTFTSVPKFVLSGIAFFDKNGNSLIDSGEEPIPDVKIAIDDTEIKTDDSGSYSFEGMIAGKFSILISSEGYRYISLSPQEIQIIDRPMSVNIGCDKQLNIGLMQGFLTLPVSCESIIGETKYVDLDHRIGNVLRWDGLTSGPSLPDQHPGIDYHGLMDTPIFASAPGIVIASADATDPTKTVRLIHDLGGEKYVTDYAHNNLVVVNVGDQVERGDIIAYMGKGGVQVIHLHFELWPLPVSPRNDNASVIEYIFNPDLWPWVTNSSGDQMPTGLDPYRNLFDPLSQGYWSVENDPQCFTLPSM